jgi:hypothetical protein
MACFRLVTRFPLPLRSEPFLRRRMADLTALLAPLLYLAMVRSSFGRHDEPGAMRVDAYGVVQCNLVAEEKSVRSQRAELSAGIEPSP